LQQISIAVPGCDYVGIISHELGHSLGFFHEQGRPDADQHIEVVGILVIGFGAFGRRPSFAPE
jgi:hypothetical protein